MSKPDGQDVKRASAANGPLPKNAHIVVVGAGFAGIGAAEKLLEAGYKVTQVEAQDYVGGRAKSLEMDGFSADLGANWLKLSDNALLSFAAEKGLIANYTEVTDAAVVGPESYNPIDAKSLEAVLRRPLAGTYIWHQLRRLFGARPRAASIKDLVGETLQKSGAKGRALEALLKLNFAAELDQLSALVLLEDESEDVGVAREPTVLGGMQTLANALLQRSSPVLNECVSTVRYTDLGVTVVTDKRQIEADAVVVTVSVEVLKNGGIRFEPALPTKHQEALNAMDMGGFYKLWMRFSEVCWSFENTVLVFDQKCPFDVVFDFSESHGEPVILGVAAGSDAKKMEDMGDERAAEQLLSQMSKQLGIDLPKPSRFAANSWGKNKFVGGAYFYPNTKYRNGTNLNLREPVSGRVFLAGEALDKDHGYVDTAWRDGRRAAGLIMGE